MVVQWDDESRVARFKNFLGATMDRTKEGLRRSGLELKRQIQLNLSGPAHMSYTYWDRGTTKARIAAAAIGSDVGRIKSSNRALTGRRYSATSNTNQYPGVRSGNLRASVTSEQSASGLSVLVGPNTRYARIQEKGGKAGRGHKVTIPARPFVKPAWAQCRDKILDIMVRAVGGRLQ